MRQSDKENVVFDPETERRPHAEHDGDGDLGAVRRRDRSRMRWSMRSASCPGLPREVVEEDVGGILTEFEEAGILIWTE